MKELIDQITNKSRLIKLYRCEGCKGSGKRWTSGMSGHINSEPVTCPDCQGNGYTINRDIHVVDIVDKLCHARTCLHQGLTLADPNVKYTGLITAEDNLAKALIKLIELACNLNINKELDNCTLNDIDSDIKQIIITISLECYLTAFNSLLSFCNHHDIDIWQSVKEILEGEAYE